MSESKHTPGPWVLGKPGRNGEDEHMCEVMTAYASGDDAKSYDLICECRKTSSIRIPVTEKIANARLIAAAPDLLACLKLLDERGFTQATWALCVKAIAKAEGDALPLHGGSGS